MSILLQSRPETAIESVQTAPIAEKPPLPTPLIDRFGRTHSYLRISVTDYCPLHCTYCMPEEGVNFLPQSAHLSFNEIEQLARVFVSLGVNKIRITGGEPTSRPGLEELIERLAGIDGLETLALTTNGLTLAKQAQRYKQAGLNALNISLDSLRPERYQAITESNSLPQVLEGIQAALNAGFSPLKLNMVVMSGINDNELLDFVHLAKDQPLEVRFIEFMPFKANQWSENRLVSFQQMKATIEARYPLQALNNKAHEVAKAFSIPGFSGKISFITSMTEHFCGDCNRLRLTTEGNLKPCLFSPTEVQLRHLLQDKSALRDAIQEALHLKPEGHQPMALIQPQENRSMIQIGG